MKEEVKTTKKWIALLLAAVLCLSLAACGTGDNSPQDTDEPSNTELTEQTVEITIDNWQDYFEIKSVVLCGIGVNAFDEVDSVAYDFWTIFTLKEEFADNR